jgi:scyllo-inositol 2-dehydrogenase (NADP+)
LGAHLIDQAVALFGLPDWVQADVSKQRPNAVVDDYFHIIFGYDQLRVILHSSSVVKASTPRFILHGDQGSFVKFGLDPQEAVLRAGLTPESHSPWDVEDKALTGVLTSEKGKRKVTSTPGVYPNFYQHVYESITEGKPFPITHSQAIQVIQLIEMSKQSSDEGAKIFTS